MWGLWDWRMQNNNESTSAALFWFEWAVLLSRYWLFCFQSAWDGGGGSDSPNPLHQERVTGAHTVCLTPRILQSVVFWPSTSADVTHWALHHYSAHSTHHALIEWSFSYQEVILVKMMENMKYSQLLLLLVSGAVSVSCSKVRNVYWNTSTTGHTDQPLIVTVNEDNLPWEYDQVNLICPVVKTGDNDAEQHVIYRVEKEEYDNCKVTSPRPRIVAVCNRPETFMYFTITFRSFTPTPGGLEFIPGQEYYFISTSNNRDIHRRVGGWCKSHNMKMIVKVAETQTELNFKSDQKSTTFSPIPSPAAFWSQFRSDKNSRSEYQQTSQETYFREESAEFRDERVDISISARSHNSSSTSSSSVSFYVQLLVSTSLWLLSSRLWLNIFLLSREIHPEKKPFLCVV